MVQFGGAHFLLEFRLDEDVAQDFVRGHQAVAVAQQDVIDADDVVVAQIGVIKEVAADMDRGDSVRSAGRGREWRRC